LSEAEFLDAEAERARTRMKSAAARLTHDLGQGLSPLQWTRDHPWLGLGAGLVGGFAAAATVIPSKRQQELNRLREVSAALHPPPPQPPHAAGDKSNGSAEKAGHKSLGEILIPHLLGILRPMVIILLKTLMSPSSRPPAPPPQTTPTPDAPPASDHPR
jgi:hypothetical protein